MSMITIGVIIACVIITMVLCLAPPKFMEKALSVFTFSNYGLRRIRRRRDTVDTLANVYLLICTLFCLLYLFIPFYWIVYLVLLLFGFLCVLAQVYRISSSYGHGKRIVLIFCICLIVSVGCIGSTGLLNDHALDGSIQLFVSQIFKQEILSVLYWFRNMGPMSYVVQMILFAIPLYVLGSQFKYMRLENTFKAYHIVTMVIKTIFICAIIVLLGYKSFDALVMIYQISPKEV